MEANAANPEVHEPSPYTRLDRHLAETREAKGLTLEVVARKLRLSIATLQALESSRYEDLPEPIFVRGYLRSYARLLGMDEDVLVAEYDRLVPAPDPVLMPTTMARRQATTLDLNTRGVTALIVVAIAVLLGSLWYHRLKHDVPARSQAVSSEAEQPVSLTSVLPPPRIDSPSLDSGLVVAAPPPDFPSQPLASATPGESAAAGEPEPPIGEPADAGEPALTLVSESQITVNANAEVQGRDVVAIVEPAVQDLPVAPLASEHGRLVKASRAPAGEDVLIIKTNDESWAEVVDANGYQLLYYLLRPGMVRHLQGQAPFRVFLGNASAVDLNLNQERFDHTPFHRRNSTALFSVDDAS